MTRWVRCTRRAFWWTGIAAILCVAASTVSAHEAGTTRVTIALSPQRTYDVEVITDATSLAEKLAAVADAPFPAGLSPSALEHAIAAASNDLRERIAVRFDNVSVRPTIAVSVLPPSDPTSVPAAVIHLTGDVPASATAMHWRFGWTFTAYQLMVRRGGSEEPSQIVDSGDADTTIALADRQMPASRRLTETLRVMRLGASHTLARGVSHTVFVLGLVLFGARTRRLFAPAALLAATTVVSAALFQEGVALNAGATASLTSLSIAGLALLNVMTVERARWQLLVLFAFAVVHGLVMASALGGADLSGVTHATGVTAFTAGCLLGEAVVFATAFVLIGWGWSRHGWYYGRVIVPASALMTCVAVLRFIAPSAL
ncbi:MAG: HupE/UreJ family protein [Vicinamibacterales bacterium]